MDAEKRKHLFFLYWGRYIILLFNGTAISVHSERMVESWGYLERMNGNRRCYR